MIDPQTTLLLGHSPDPDDAFMFYGMAQGKVALRGYHFEHILQDIQTLNERARAQELHISAISIHAYVYVQEHYALLPCGASMGDGYGPMFVVSTENKKAPDATAPLEERLDWLKRARIAIPGTMTTAYLSSRLLLGEFEKVVVPFDQIFETVASGQADAGVIIHEGQLTFAQEGFRSLLDLGAWWKEETGLPLPLGGNVIRKDFSLEQRSEINNIIKESIAYGLAERRAAVAHSMKYARGLNEAEADRFIGMYVNDYTLDYGDSGRAAIKELLGRGAAAGIIPSLDYLEFVK